MTELTHVELYNQIAQGIITDLKPYIDKGENIARSLQPLANMWMN